MLRDRRYIAIILSLGIVSALNGILGNVASSMLPSTWKPYLWLSWPFFGILVVVSVGLVILQEHAEHIKISSADKGAAESSVPSRGSLHLPREDWDSAPDVRVFYGRQEELATLEQWITIDRCRLIGILGMGGIGKTALAVKLAKQLHSSFDYVLWRSLLNAPHVETILYDCIMFLSDHKEREIALNFDASVMRLIECLKEKRCLLVFDNFEAILQGGRVGQYLAGYEGYSYLIQQLADTVHQSCVILTSREKLKEIVFLESASSLTRSYRVNGLGLAEGRELLKEKNVFGSDVAWEVLVDRYAGNPMNLKLISGVIREVFAGDITSFLLVEDGVIFSDVRQVLDQQFNRLSLLEQEIIYWLAIAREVISLDVIREDIPRSVSKLELLEALMSLKQRHLVEAKEKTFMLQNVIMEYVTDQLVDRICIEITTESVSLLMSHALIKADAKDYVRESQLRLILKPVLERLLTVLGRKDLEEKIRRILAELYTKPQQQGYLGGNILNLLVQLHANLDTYNLSHLVISQAYLQDVNLQNVDFAYSHFVKTVFTETFGSVLSVAFSLDGQRLSAGTASGDVWLWQTAGSRLLLTCPGHTDWVRSVVFSPDGTLLASGSEDRTIRIWDTHTGECRKVLEGHSNWVRSVVFSPDGTLLASGSEDRTIRIWDAHTGECRTILQDGMGRVWSIAYSHNGKTIAAVNGDYTVHIWEVSSVKCLKTLGGEYYRMRSVAFNPDDTLLATGCLNQIVCIWDVETGQCLKMLQAHSKAVRSVAFSPDGNLLASGGEDCLVCLWEVDTGQNLRTLQGHTSHIWSVAFNPDGSMLASGSEDQTVRLWDVATGQGIKTFHGHANRFWSVAFSPNNTLLGSGSLDQIVRLWDMKTGRCLMMLQGHTGQIWSVTFSSDGKLLASGSADQTVRLWEVSTGKCLKVLYGHEHSTWVRSVIFSPDRKILASGGEDQTVRLWEVSTGKCLKVLYGHENWVWSVAFSPDGKIIASSSGDNTIRLWEVNTGQSIKTLGDHTGRVRSVAFSPDGELLASGSEDQTVCLWEVSTGKCLKVLHGHENWVWSVAFSSDGHILATGSADQTIRLWEMGTKECIMVLQGHTGQIWSVAFSMYNSDILASASDDGSIKLWDVKAGKCLNTLTAHKPYEQMNIMGVTGINEAQKATLKTLGAIEK